MVDRLAELGADVTWDQVTRIARDSVVGRPHIARAMVAAGVIAEPEDAFTSEWIADDGRAYVAKYALDPVRAIGLIKAAGVSPSSPIPGAGRAWDLSDQEIAGLAAAGLAGLEVAHPDHDAAERQALLRLATTLDLVPTAGSDDHGSFTGARMGTETATADTLARLHSEPPNPARTPDPYPHLQTRPHRRPPAALPRARPQRVNCAIEPTRPCQIAPATRHTGGESYAVDGPRRAAKRRFHECEYQSPHPSRNLGPAPPPRAPLLGPPHRRAAVADARRQPRHAATDL